MENPALPKSAFVTEKISTDTDLTANAARKLILIRYNFFVAAHTVPPTMSQEHDEYTIIVNSPVQLSCEVTGLPPPTVAWLKNGQPLDFANKTSTNIDGMMMLSNGALRIHHTRVEDAGLYECVATSVAGTASRQVALHVQGTCYILCVTPHASHFNMLYSQ